MSVAVGLDVGTTGVKALAITATGEVAAHAEHGYPLSTPQVGWSEQDPEDWWLASEAALADVSAGHDDLPSGARRKARHHEWPSRRCAEGQKRIRSPRIASATSDSTSFVGHSPSNPAPSHT